MKSIKIIICCILLSNTTTSFSQNIALNIKNKQTDQDIKAIDAEKCTKIAEDRPRLVCFDRIYQTPSFALTFESPTVKTKHPIEWGNAWNKEKKRSPDDQDFLQHVEPGNFLNSITLTLPLENNDLLVLSCIDKISRIEIMLNSAISDGVVPVLIKNKAIKATNWFSDDSGFILRAGRGIPSINIMKHILNQKDFTIEFKKQSIPVYSENLEEKIKLLRTTCTW